MQMPYVKKEFSVHPSSTALDRETAEGLYQNMEEQKAHDILISFVSDAHELTKEIVTAFEKKDFEAIIKACHMLSATSAQIGAHNVHNHVIYLEARAENQRANAVEISSLHDLIHEVSIDIDAFLATK